MQAVGRSVQHEMETLREGAHPLQGATQQCSKIHPQTRPRQPRTLERRFVVARQDPGLVGDARRVGSKRHVIPAGLDHASSLAFLLLEDVAENAALFGDEILAAGA